MAVDLRCFMECVDSSPNLVSLATRILSGEREAGGELSQHHPLAGRIESVEYSPANVRARIVEAATAFHNCQPSYERPTSCARNQRSAHPLRLVNAATAKSGYFRETC